MTKLSDRQRVVVTGLGVISSLGIGWEEFWKNIMAGKSGISRITAFDTSSYDRHYAGEVKNFDPAQFINRRKIPMLGRASQMAIAASRLAIRDAGMNIADLRQLTCGVCIGTTMGEIRLLEKFADKQIVEKKQQVSENKISVFPSSSLGSNIAVELKLKGHNLVFATACASGNYAIGEAYDLIRSQKADFALAGGTDGFSRIVFTGFGRLFAMAPEKCQPFDKNRKGMMTGEGAGILLLENLENAKKRKAKIYAEILGYGMSCDASSMTAPLVCGIARSMKRALQSSGVKPEEIGYISAHGTGTIENDSAECKAAREVFGKNTDKIPMSSIKSMLGHTMGAASALEAIACCLAIARGEVPPTINIEEQDPECRFDCVPNKGRKYTVRIALNNSQAFGGNNASAIFSKVSKYAKS